MIREFFEPCHGWCRGCGEYCAAQATQARLVGDVEGSPVLATAALLYGVWRDEARLPVDWTDVAVGEVWGSAVEVLAAIERRLLTEVTETGRDAGRTHAAFVDAYGPSEVTPSGRAAEDSVLASFWLGAHGDGVEEFEQEQDESERHGV